MAGDMFCETCNYYIYDDDLEEYICDVNMDEDDYYRLMQNDRKKCPFYKNGDEYAVVKKQM